MLKLIVALVIASLVISVHPLPSQNFRKTKFFFELHQENDPNESVRKVPKQNLKTNKEYPVEGILSVNPITSNGFKKKSQLYELKPNNSTHGSYTQAAVATSSKQCAKIGKDVLLEGGSAVDSAIATLLCDGVISLQGMGVGGGFLMTIWDATEKTSYFLNARESAPSNLKLYENITEAATKRGPLSIAVPGEIKGYWKAHQRFGKLPWSRLFEPTIKICEEGSLISRYVANDLKEVEEEIKRYPDMKNILWNFEEDRVKGYNEVIYRKALAKTFREIAKNGAKEFYEGSVGKSMVEDLQRMGSVITMDDLKDYNVEWMKPEETNFYNMTIYSSNLPGSGVILGYMMKILVEKVPTAPNETIMWQRIAEIFKHSYGARTKLADMDFSNHKRIKRTLKDLRQDYPERTQPLIWDHITINDPRLYDTACALREDHGTAHTSVLAPDGSAVSVTSTINHVLGSMIRSPSTGIILNDQMDDFSYPGFKNGFGQPYSEVNAPSYKKRPMSSMVPSIVLDEDEKVRLIVGAAGGTKITSGVALVMVHNLIRGLRIHEAIDKPRIHHQLDPMVLQFEPGFPQNISNYLTSIGHKKSDFLVMKSTISGIEVFKNKIYASGDYRREGGTDGY